MFFKVTMDQKQLRNYEHRCIQEEAPWCQASCPLHVDARQLCRHVASGDAAKAWEVLLRHMPAPGILARICDHPCEAACKRAQAGDPVRIGALERFVASMPEPRARKLPMPPRQGEILILGAGLSSLVVAHDLAKKGYGVVLRTGSGQAGGTLLDLSEEKLPRDAIEHEVERLQGLKVAVECGAKLPAKVDESIFEGFGAVFIGGDDPSTAQLLEGLEIDQPTMAVSEPGMFAVAQENVFSAMAMAFGGRRAAVSIDRHLQGVSLTAERHKEGPYQTRLYTNIDDVKPEPAVPMADPAVYTEAEAGAEAERCLECQCLECVKACRYLEHYKSYPKVYVRQIYNNEAIVKGHHQANTFINSCMLCGLCTKVCPEDFPMAEVCLGSRQGMVSRDKMPPSAHWFALNDMGFSNSLKFSMARHEPGMSGSRWLFYPGCQLAGSAPSNVEAVYAHLRGSLEGGVGLALGCCGAPAWWAGREDEYDKAMSSFADTWQEMGKPRIITACTTCLSMFRHGLPEAGIISLWQALDDYGLPQAATAGGKDGLLVNDPCTARELPEVRASVRNVMAKIGIKSLEFEKYGGELAKCCGFGGLTFNADQDMGRMLADDRAAEHEGDYLAYCAMCRDRLAKSGKRVLHLLDVLFAGEADPGERPDPGFSARQENRFRLRERLLAEHWKEKSPAMEAYEKIELIMSPETAESLERRRVLVRDVKQAIEYAERTGKRLQHVERGTFLASHKPGAVTFWVEYRPKGEAFEVQSAWSHRMEIKGASL